MSENRHPTVVISKVIELFNPLWHLVASEEIVNSQTEPAAQKYKHDKQHLLEKVAFEVIDLQCSLDRQYKTDNPTNKCNHSIKVLVNVDAKIQISREIIPLCKYFLRYRHSSICAHLIYTLPTSLGGRRIQGSRAMRGGARTALAVTEGVSQSPLVAVREYDRGNPP